MVARDSNMFNAFETTLTSLMGVTDLTATVASTTGLTSPCYLVIDPDTPSLREYIYFDGTFTGTTFVTSSTANRYLSGSAAGSGLTHAVGAKVRCAPVSQHFEDLHDRIDGSVAKTLVDAKGDLLVGSAADTVARQAVGADDSILMADAAQANGVKWAAAAATAEIADVATAEAAGTSDTYARGDHVHALAANVVTTAKIADANVTGAKLAAALPQGFLGYASLTGQDNVAGPGEDIVNMSVAVTVAASRRIRITAHYVWSNDTAASNNIGQFKEGATVLGKVGQTTSAGAGYVYTHSSSVIVRPSAGVHTYKIAHTLTAGAVVVYGAPEDEAFILVEDIGPA